MRFLNNNLNRNLTKQEDDLIQGVELVVNQQMKREVFAITINPLHNNDKEMFGFSVALKRDENNKKNQTEEK